MPKYVVQIDVQSLLIHVEADNEESAIDKAEDVFFGEARSRFYIENSEIVGEEE